MDSELFKYAVFKEEEKIEGSSPPLYDIRVAANGYKLEEKTLDSFDTLLEGYAKTVKTFPNNN